LHGNDGLIGGNNNGTGFVTSSGYGSRLRASETMSILKLLGKHTFDVDTTIILASAFDAAWLSMQTSGSPFAADDRASQTRDLLAHAAGAKRTIRDAFASEPQKTGYG
jgi:hypothetical protein